MEVLGIIVWLFVFAILFTACVLDLWHNPLKHPRKFIWMRFGTIFSMGMTYACLFAGRYNWAAINTDEVRNALGLDKTSYGSIITAGLWSYAGCVLFNGVVVDRIGGRRGIIIGAFGSGLTNLAMGLIFHFAPTVKGINFLPLIWGLVIINNYFQSFGSLAIVKIGAYWYHLFERGFFSGIFGVIVGFGFFLAFNVNQAISAGFNDAAGHGGWHYCFLIPAAMLGTFGLFNVFFIRARPVDAGFDAIEETEVDGSNGKVDQDKKHTFKELVAKVMLNPIFVKLALTELCLGWDRDGILNWYRAWFEDTFHTGDASDPLALAGGLITIGAMFGSLFAGVVSDLVFQSRRPPVAFLGMAGYLVIAIGLYFVKGVWPAAVLVGLTSFFFSSVHGITVSTCAMDFAGSGATATAVGLLDGTQKLGSGVSGVTIGAIIQNWGYKTWIISLWPAAVIALLMLSTILKKRPPVSFDKRANDMESPTADPEGNIQEPLLQESNKEEYGSAK